MTEELVKMKEQVYFDERPKEFFDRYHERSRTQRPNWVYEIVRIVTSIYAYTFFRARSIASQNVPPSGPVILAPNHFSFMDHFFTGAFIRRKVRFMAKSQLFKRPLVWIYSPGGVFPVRRGAPRSLRSGRSRRRSRSPGLRGTSTASTWSSRAA
jgi:1-acyl-sn-glycerol-3-phosphate acyltransferase